MPHCRDRQKVMKRNIVGDAVCCNQLNKTYILICVMIFMDDMSISLIFIFVHLDIKKKKHDIRSSDGERC